MPTIEIDDATMALLKKHARFSSQSKEAILTMAVSDFDSRQPDIATAVETGRRQVAAGDTVSHDAVLARLQAMGLNVR